VGLHLNIYAFTSFAQFFAVCGQWSVVIFFLSLDSWFLILVSCFTCIKYFKQTKPVHMAIELSKGCLVAIEGIDGSGKSTQAKRLARYFSQTGLTVRVLREPTDGPCGQEIRRLAREGRRQVTPEQELELFIQDRIEDCRKNIRPALERRELVLIDRYYFSTIAYQGALGLDTEEIRRRNEKIAVIPDLVLILDLPVKKGLARIVNQRGDRHDDFEKSDFLMRVRSIFRSMAWPYVKHISADRDQELVFEEMKTYIEALIERVRI
jgi:dTMP kinase